MIRFILMGIIAISYLMAGVFLIPFGRAGAYYRRISGDFGINLLWACGAKATWSGLEKLDPNKRYVFMGNHQSYVDIYIVQASLISKGMRTLFMVKKELFIIPFFKTMTKHMGLIPVEREESRNSLQALMEAVKTVKQGYSLTIFPEGTRSVDGELLPFKRGGFLLAERTGMQIVPFAITGTKDILNKKSIRVKPGNCHISFLDPIDPKGIRSRDLAEKVEKLIKDKYEQDLKNLKTN